MSALKYSVLSKSRVLMLLMFPDNGWGVTYHTSTITAAEASAAELRRLGYDDVIIVDYHAERATLLLLNGR